MIAKRRIVITTLKDGDAYLETERRHTSTRLFDEPLAQRHRGRVGHRCRLGLAASSDYSDPRGGDKSQHQIRALHHSSDTSCHWPNTDTCRIVAI